MIKKVFLIFVLLIAGVASLISQNLQLHFDPRKAIHGEENFNKNYITTTFEMFKPDKWGSTFMFVDLDLNMSKANIGLAYLEIARDQNLGSFPLKAHVEFNGGLVKNMGGGGFSINNSYLGGVSYPFALGKFNLNTYLVYKFHTFDKSSHDVQWTLTWGANFFDDKLTVCGFIDIWTENKNREKLGWKSEKKVIIITEPQLWYNVTPNLSFGTEIEISSNFHKNIKFEDKAFVNPTIAGKWIF